MLRRPSEDRALRHHQQSELHLPRRVRIENLTTRGAATSPRESHTSNGCAERLRGKTNTASGVTRASHSKPDLNSLYPDNRFVPDQTRSSRSTTSSRRNRSPQQATRIKRSSGVLSTFSDKSGHFPHNQSRHRGIRIKQGSSVTSNLLDESEPMDIDRPPHFNVPSAIVQTNMGLFGAPSQPSAPSQANPFATPSPFGNSSPFGAASSSFGAPSNPFATSRPQGPPINPFARHQSSQNGVFSAATTSSPAPKSAMKSAKSTPNPTREVRFSSNPMAPPLPGTLASKIDRTLQKDGLVAPAWPKDPGDPKQKGAMEKLWHDTKAYRSNVREALIRVNLIDEMDIQKNIEDAIEFKGTCEDMCPEFEKITRIMESNVQNPEKETAPNGSLQPCPEKMVKQMARAAAGQENPLPMDVRSPAALKRTLDYLVNTVLGHADGKLPAVHGFLWDRTRAIRRDFSFQAKSMSKTDLLDYVYCLEQITRFHVIALHQMSHPDVTHEGFSEQQEIEQLKKTMLSLKEAYEDCNDRDIACENEAEFRAYYALLNCHDPIALETVQSWGYDLYEASGEVQLAIMLVETLQNIWDPFGPLKPESQADVAQNAFSKYFLILNDPSVSYTLACFAEIHFNRIRKAAFKTILSSFSKPAQAKDWTLAELNQYLRFDNEEDVIEFGEAYGLAFDESSGQTHLTYIRGAEVSEPFPPLRQGYSYSMVERKRGDHSLPHVIHKTVYAGGNELESAETTLDFGTHGSEDHLSGPLDHPVVAPSSNINTIHATIGGMTPSSSLQDNHLIKESNRAPIADARSVHAQQEPASLLQPIFSLNNGNTTFAVGPTTEPVPPVPAVSFVPNDVPLAVSSQPSRPLFSFASPVSDSKGTDPITSGVPTAQNTSFNRLAPLINGIGLGSSTIPVPPTTAIKFSPSTSDNGFILTTNVSVPTSTFASAPSTNALSPTLVPPSFKTDSPTQRNGFARQKSIVQDAQLHSSDQAAFPPTSAEIVSENIEPISTPKANRRGAQLDGFSNWMFHGEDGLLEHFIFAQVAQVVMDGYQEIVKEDSIEAARKKDESDRQEADSYRYRSLATKYFSRWRVTTRNSYLRRRGREARKARAEMAKNIAAAKAAKAANVVEDFKASKSSYRDLNNFRRASLESLLGATGVLNGVHDPTQEIKSIVQGKRSQVSGKRRRSEHALKDPNSRSPISKTSSISKHKRGRSDDPFRRSLLSDPSFTSGESRYTSKYDEIDDSRPSYNGVQTDYFRLQARGIHTMADGRPMAASALSILKKRRSFEETTRSPSPKLPTPPEDIQVLKSRAKAISEGARTSDEKKRKGSVDVDDEELFARAKRVREQLEQDEEWYRKQVRKLSASVEMSSERYS
ncbi:SAC3/GANP/Nin1/mts3/eIF-3 p25 family-domain-containing protein [Bisporella sp. PMI_857]|nr:SAC3/GANP/Nin1/mts3/eIF-3 p25 family-domain-containing protein [Bisporella sp. PMI_857]